MPLLILGCHAASDSTPGGAGAPPDDEGGADAGIAEAGMGGVSASGGVNNDAGGGGFEKGGASGMNSGGASGMNSGGASGMNSGGASGMNNGGASGMNNGGASGMNNGGGVGATPGALPGTSFLNGKALLGSIDDPNWFLANIPFFEAPDDQIQGVYYYRFQTYKEHLVDNGPVYGFLSTEFLHPVGYGAPYGGVVAAAGHQITEGRWLRTQQYVKDDINYWLNGPGQFPKAMVDGVNADTSDWAHEYSFWAASSVWQEYLATGDREFAIAELPALIRQFEGWANHFDATLGLYWQVPVWDATEFSPSSYESSDPYHGGAGFRPTINAYQYGDAQAIAAIAQLKGDTQTAAKYTDIAGALQTNMQQYLWDPERKFFYDLPRDNNPSSTLLGSREEMGFVPWMFDMPQASDVTAFAQLLDPMGFASAYGPTTTERRSKWFMHDASGCCRWDGPSWPYETAQTLTGLANLLDDYPTQTVITAQNYVDLLHTYAVTQHKNGRPYVAEAHDPDAATWIYDGFNGSEDYNHSTFDDLVISGLVGVRGQANDTLVVKPLAPATWDYFALENLPYHGHDITVLWDRVGTRYNQGTGLFVFVDGKRVVSQADLSAVTVPVGAAVTQSNRLNGFNVAVNGQRFGSGTTPSATYTSSVDDVWRGIDGIIWREGIPENTRWTSYASSTPTDTYSVDFRRDVTVDDVQLYFYDDGGGVRVPASYDLQYYNGIAWLSVPGQTRTPLVPAANGLTEISFAPLTTKQLRVVAPNAGKPTGWGLSEFSARSKPIFQIVNANSSLLLAVSSGASQDDRAQVQQFHATGTPGERWELVDAGAGFFKIVNLASGLVLAVADASLSTGALAQQRLDSVGAEALWSFIDTGNGRFKIKNHNSGRLLGVDLASSSDSANVIQTDDTSATDRLWTLQASASSQLSFDDFESGSASQWTALTGAWAPCHPASEEYCSTGGVDGVSLTGVATWRNYTVDALVRSQDSVADSSVGVILRAQDATHYYVGELNQEADGTSTWDISKIEGGTVTTLARGFCGCSAGANQIALRFAAQGGTLSFGVVSSSGAVHTLGSAFDTTFSSGEAGLRTRKSTGSFDAVRVTAG